MRLYVPVTASQLRSLATEPLSAVTACAVTPALIQWVDAAEPAERSDAEEYEYAALSEAARDSLRLTGASELGRRIVLAVDVLDAAVTDVEGEPGRVTVAGANSVGLQDLASVHMDDAEASGRVRLAAAAIAAADAGDAGAEQVVAALDDDELLWYAPEELADLLRELFPD